MVVTMKTSQSIKGLDTIPLITTLTILRPENSSQSSDSESVSDSSDPDDDDPNFADLLSPEILVDTASDSPSIA